MDSAVLVSVASVLAGGIGVLGTVLVNRRRRSGRIDTTEAAELWVEGRAMRQELRDELARVLIELTDANREIKELRQNLSLANSELMHANNELEELRSNIASYEDEVEALRVQVAVLREGKS